MRAVVLGAVIVAACSGLPARNDPATSKSFYCARSDAKPERSLCTIDDVDACRSAVTVATSEGLYMSPCVAQPWAWCAVGSTGTERLFVCGVDAVSCEAQRDESQRRGEIHNTGACIRRTIGQ